MLAHATQSTRWVSTSCRTAHWRLQGYECSPWYTLGRINNREIARSWPAWTPARATSFRSYDTWLHYNRMRGQLRNVDCAQPPLRWTRWCCGLLRVVAENVVTDRQMDRQTKYCNPRCACTLRANRHTLMMYIQNSFLLLLVYTNLNQAYRAMFFSHSSKKWICKSVVASHSNRYAVRPNDFTVVLRNNVNTFWQVERIDGYITNVSHIKGFKWYSTCISGQPNG